LNITANLLELNYRSMSPVKTLFNLFRYEKKNVILAIVLLVIKHSPALFLPLIIGNVINAIVHSDGNTWHSIILNSIFIMFLFIQNLFTHTWFVKSLSRAVRSVEKSLRHALVKRMQELSISFHDNFESGRLQSKVLRDVESVEILSRQLVNAVFTGIINILFSIVVTLMYDWLVALFYLITIPLATLLIQKFRVKMRKSNLEYRSEIENMSARVSEMVQMIPIARAHALEETEIRQMDEQFEKVRSGGIRLDVVNAFFGASTWVTFQIFQFACLIVTAFMAWYGRIGIGDVVMYQGFFAMIINSVNMIITILPELNRGFDSIRSLGEILECPDIELNQGKEPVDMVQGEIEFENVRFEYQPEVPVLKSVSFNARPGECVAFVGASGAGKSTIMNLIIGYRRPQQGRILLDGRNMTDLDLRTYRQYISVVPQNILLFSGSVRENILYGIDQETVSDDWFDHILEVSRLKEFVFDLPQGLDTRIGEYGNRLSGGQKQRIAIARSLIRDPRIILFDEATSALDSESEKHIQDALTGMIKGRTTFMIAHRLSTILKADRIIVLKNGEIAESGSFQELLERKGIFEKFYKLQIGSN
jgi:ATP-binding cassette, subfamily B, bacterial